MRISERTDFTPNKTKEVSLQKCGMILEKLQIFQGLLKKLKFLRKFKILYFDGKFQEVLKLIFSEIISKL